MNKPYVSIIVPVYNVEPYVEACIRSVMRQTYDGRIECIVVDDCGTDNSMVVVERLISEYNGPITFKILSHTHNRGPSAARNTGMDSAKGDYIFFMDSDDEMTNDCLKTLIDPLKENQYNIIVGLFETIDEEGSFHHGKMILPNKSHLVGYEILQSYCKGNLFSMVWNKLYPVSFLRSHNLRFQEGIIYEDELWTFLLVCISQSLYVVNKTTYKYRRRKNSISTSNAMISEIKAKAYYTQVIEMGKFVKEKRINEDAAIEFISERFYATLRLQIHHPFAFIYSYRKMRQSTMKPLNDFFRQKSICRKQSIHDFHFLIPSLIAPYFEYVQEVILIKLRFLFLSLKKVFSPKGI